MELDLKEKKKKQIVKDDLKASRDNKDDNAFPRFFLLHLFLVARRFLENISCPPVYS